MDMVTKSLPPEELRRLQARDQQQAAAATKGAPEFVDGDAGRTLSVPLAFPVKWGDVTYSEVTVRRPLMREYRAYLRAVSDAVRLNGPGADDLVDQVWLSIPAIVLENLDFADATRVEAAMEGFFGRSGLPDETDEKSTSESTTGDPSPSP